jgi:citrate lyase subunit beta/citryl-CoA lyase
MRSLLFVPGDTQKKLDKGLGSSADVLLIDLEDSVAAEAKPAARKLAAEFIAAHRGAARRPQLYVRVNALSTGLTDADLGAVMAAGPDGIMLPKAEGGVDVSHIAARIALFEAENDLPDGATRIIAIATETARGLFQMGTYGGASHRLAGLTWGAEDLSADLGAETNRNPDGSFAPAYQLARTLTLVGARAAGVEPIDSIFGNFRDLDGLRLESEAARREGFTGKMAIHPAQVAVINETFTPTPEAVTRARQIVAAFAASPEAGVIGLDGEMLDRPHLLRAQRTLARLGPDTAP